MKRSIHTFLLFDEEELYGPPIPEIATELAKYQPHNSPEEVAYMVLQRVRKWMSQHPGKDWWDITPPAWHGYLAGYIEK